ncbi:glutamic acid-rich protein-like [Hemibagrus wyckioides]|uniref:glutamic acid-rich protein-like n=1 Tax=Hemibagrus wyckioides TaxID=337641 RepID=UPI00266D500F|nr:glutamic acid-rich protein-like [Hemibagrus wyckioides]
MSFFLYMCIIRATQLQYQLQELSERERRARHHNQKLLQDFQRAQNTLSDLVARSEAMNTIRMEYESFLEENYPKWQQKLQEKRLSEQQKMLEQHLKTCTLHTEEEGQRIGTGNKHPFRINTSSAISPDLSHCAILHSLQHISDHRNNVAEGSKQNMQGNVHSSFPSSWLTQSLIPVTELEHGISKNSKNTQNVHQVLNSSLLDHNCLTGDPVVLQDHHSCEHLRQYPNSWAPGCGKRVECPIDCPSWSHLPLINGDKVRREENRRPKKQEASANFQGDNHHMQKLRKKVNSSDTEPVNISTYYGDTSESSGLYTKAIKSLPTKVQRARIKRRVEKQTHNTRKDAVSEWLSSVSDRQSVSNHKKQKRKERSNGRKTALKTSKAAVNSPKQLVKENKDDGNSIDETLTSICCKVKTGGMKRYEEDTEEEEEILGCGDMRVNEATNRDSTENQGNRASLCEERHEKGEVEERYRAKSSTDEEAPEEKPLRSDTSVKESHILEEVDSVRESEEEEGGVGEEEEEDEVKGDEDEKSRPSGRRSNEDENKSDQEGNYSEVLKSDSERSIQDR